ncbi:helix-turn-helix transcriptional regulator [Enterobacillus tribolii]|uniref:Uncharacterized protein n=1 Tax=Enterobacillus tribolii TaxID=1487935 RepID=A0A370QNP6_9GAMM|nr:hypothetical protein [Enterobacillus tribolii]MBW7981990.1 hypothetical protein [Enterobacillus tribolii]RDK89991.1 hypothetical protein C8D90_106197 [Enterobacillus tribolii]
MKEHDIITVNASNSGEQINKVHPQKNDIYIFDLDTYSAYQGDIFLAIKNTCKVIFTYNNHPKILNPECRDLFLSKKVVLDKIEFMIKAAGRINFFSALTLSEFRTFYQILTGKSINCISRELNVSSKQIYRYRDKAFKKMGFNRLSYHHINFCRYVLPQSNIFGKQHQINRERM